MNAYRNYDIPVTGQPKRAPLGVPRTVGETMPRGHDLNRLGGSKVDLLPYCFLSSSQIPTVYRTGSRGWFRIGPLVTVPFQVSDTPQVEYPGYRVPYFNRGQHLLSLIQPADIKPSSSLAIQKVEKPLACGQAVSITIRYAIVGETVPKGSVAVLYLVSRTRNNLQTHGASQIAPYFLFALLLTHFHRKDVPKLHQ